MDIHTLSTALIIEILQALILIVPVLAIAVMALLRSYTNSHRIDNRPTHDEVQTLIDNKVKELGGNGN